MRVIEAGNGRLQPKSRIGPPRSTARLRRRRLRSTERREGRPDRLPGMARRRGLFVLAARRCRATPLG